VAEPVRRKPRHLIDFDNPRPAPTRGGMSLSEVQKWVMSVLAFVTIEHLAGGIVLAAVFTDERHAAARVGLNVMASVTGVLAVLLVRVIHGKPLLSPWLLVGLLPGLVGAWFCFGR
jgi:hypothetical protein